MHSKNTRSQASRQQTQPITVKPIAKKKKPEVPPKLAKKTGSRSVEESKKTKKKETKTQQSN